jgi:ABC-type glycerol-3-phosphate transport system substrate-binding protein
VKQNQSIHRRRLLVGSAAMAMGAVVGCRQQSETSAEPTPERSDVPLRIALVGSDPDAQSIRRGWGAVTEQPLEIQVIELNRADSGALAEAVSTAVEVNDVVIYPRTLVAQLAGAAAIVALSSDDSEQIKEACGPLFPALRSGERYAGAFFAMPLGAQQPALLSRQNAVAVASWEDYDDLIEQEWDSMASEPTAPGWAGVMFLWRTAVSKQWLFDRETLQPLIDNESYIESLQRMVRAHSRYKAKHQTPGQIWSAVQAGELQGGIGFPQGVIDGESEIQIADLPATAESSKVLLDPFSPVISLSSNCRQSAAAKRFIQWIGGGVGSDSVRQQAAGMTAIRMSSAVSTSGDSISGSVTSYNQWLAARLSSPITIPTLQILRGSQYYTALDAQVIRALNGEATPEQALAEVSKRWQATTDSVGLDIQLRAWRRAQGMRS